MGAFPLIKKHKLLCPNFRGKTNEAHRKAMELGKKANSTYKNRAGETVTIRFLGLRNLDVIHDPLEHGCEIMFFEHVGMTKARTRKLVLKKKDLEAFLPIRKPRRVPDYVSKKIMEEVKPATGNPQPDQRVKKSSQPKTEKSGKEAKSQLRRSRNVIAKGRLRAAGIDSTPT